MAKLVEAAFKAQRAFLVTAAKSTKPSADDLPKVLETPLLKHLLCLPLKCKDNSQTSVVCRRQTLLSSSITGAGGPEQADPGCDRFQGAAPYLCAHQPPEHREREHPWARLGGRRARPSTLCSRDAQRRSLLLQPRAQRLPVSRSVNSQWVWCQPLEC